MKVTPAGNKVTIAVPTAIYRGGNPSKLQWWKAGEKYSYTPDEEHLGLEPLLFLCHLHEMLAR